MFRGASRLYFSLFDVLEDAVPDGGYLSNRFDPVPFSFRDGRVYPCATLGDSRVFAIFL